MVCLSNCSVPEHIFTYMIDNPGIFDESIIERLCDSHEGWLEWYNHHLITTRIDLVDVSDLEHVSNNNEMEDISEKSKITLKRIEEAIYEPDKNKGSTKQERSYLMRKELKSIVSEYPGIFKSGREFIEEKKQFSNSENPLTDMSIQTRSEQSIKFLQEMEDRLVLVEQLENSIKELEKQRNDTEKRYSNETLTLNNLKEKNVKELKQIQETIVVKAEQIVDSVKRGYEAYKSNKIVTWIAIGTSIITMGLAIYNTPSGKQQILNGLTLFKGIFGSMWHSNTIKEVVKESTNVTKPLIDHTIKEVVNNVANTTLKEAVKSPAGAAAATTAALMHLLRKFKR